MSSLTYSGDISRAYQYTYNALGYIATYQSTDEAQVSYTYDNQGQLPQAVVSGGPICSYYNGIRWTLDWAEGRNLISAWTTVAVSDTQEADILVTYTYDAEGLRTGKTVTVETYEVHVHEYTVAEAVEPACEKDGYIRYECECGAEYRETQAATGHTYTLKGIVEATCQENGYMLYECVCGSSSQRVLTKVAHRYEEDSDGVVRCIWCGHVKNVIPVPTVPSIPGEIMSVEGEPGAINGSEAAIVPEEALQAETSLEGYVEEENLETVPEQTGEQPETQVEDQTEPSEMSPEEMTAESSLEDLVDEESTEELSGEETSTEENGTEETTPEESEEEESAEEESSEEESTEEEGEPEEASTDSRILVSTRTETHDYIYAGGTLLRDNITTTVDGTTTTQTLDFRYDESGHPYELIRTVGETTTSYYYITNLQGDVMHLVDGDGATVASYTYDPYGNILTATGDLAEVNPLRYRGYYYDGETGFYYLQSRYYDAEIERFINADSYLSTGQSFLGYNTFAYCGNNPIVHKDSSGNAAETVFDLISFGLSIVDVAANPTDLWAWAGMIGDLVDVVVPFVGGIGEATKALKAISNAVGDDVNDVAKMTKNTLGAIKDAAKDLTSGCNTVYISFKDGLLEYVGITNDFDRRKKEWEGIRNIEKFITDLDRTSARYVEQTVIAVFGKKGTGILSNKINSIGHKGSKFDGFSEFINRLID